MFDDLNQPSDPIQSGQKLNNVSVPAGAEDMFAEVEPVIEKPVQFQPRANEVNIENNSKEAHGGSMQKIFVLTMTLLGFILLSTGAYFGFNYLNAKRSSVVVKEEVAATENKSTENNLADNIATSSEDVAQQPTIDTDKDGLTDEEERQLGLNTESTDTDNDGLFDREEVRVYKTNPLNVDTDGDGVNDGDEVKSGKNPNGKGSLFDTAATSTTAVDAETSASSSTSIEGNIADPVIQKPVDGVLDSDKDGLTDVEEAKYGTDPLNSDTDGDTYLDGAEVKGGYNPIGAGKLAL